MRSVKWTGLFLIVCLGLLVWHIQDNQLETGKRLPAGVQPSSKRMMKPRSPFSVAPNVEWLKEYPGRARFTVKLEGLSFSSEKWSYEWKLPLGINPVSGEMRGDFTEPRVQESRLFVLEVEGLEADQNQNLFLKIIPENSVRAGMAIVVPSRYDKTLEGHYSARFQDQNTQQKMLSGARQNEIRRGLRF